MRALATELLYSGREHLNLGNFHSAASDLAESCENFAKVFGEASEECAECCLYYGRALLEVGRMESEVLGHALTGVDIEVEDCNDANMQVEDPEKMNDKEKDEVEKCVDEAIKSHFNMVGKIAVAHEETYLDSDDDSTEAMDTNSPSKKVSPNKKASPGKAEVQEDPSNLAHAWEMLAFAEKIYTDKAKKATEGEKRKELEARLSDAVLWMGEVAMESENYDQAASIFAECLNTRRGRYTEDSRC
jgi:tetratricopeptide (TPR) repeat protein